ncbi:Fe3+-hydroxamate ABC transporter permease FhuB [Brucella endophytica]|uniref:Fe3+-hydroxamate ABC transporter permease FhuB n=1 Tax=Brucella endophytica TaxID=1963359 RepID=A0A916SHP8_9HYPH|nr:Fe(3+)-hydroxamate ABC transporter permease FhuB [Brucella endophytica]GGA99580.1 Fe3+-hydroxamate ABC transporter permease FhuB [Brucella endophytica]
MIGVLARPRLGPASVVVFLLLLSALSIWSLVSAGLKGDGNATYDASRMVLLYSTLPRLAVAFIVGAATSLSGALFQQVLRNPLASPTTLGISAGANLSLVIAMLFFPGLLGLGRDLVALAGSAVAAAIVMSLGARRGFSPFVLILSGMVVSLWCGSLAAILTLLNDRYLASLFIWGAGSLAQQSWDIPLSLLWKTVLLAVIGALIVRPMSLLELGESNASALGVKLRQLRLVAISVAVALSAITTSAVGVIGFIGLVAPITARLAGARRTGGILIWSALIGGALLLLADATIQVLAGNLSDFLPTGAVTAVFGSPLLLLLLPRLKVRHRALEGTRRIKVSSLPRRQIFVMIGLTLAGMILIGLFVGRSLDGGWSWLGSDLVDTLLPLRAPKVLAAIASGAMLAVAGVILQRMTGNEMASPEVLGISAGATFGLMAAVFFVASPGILGQLGFAAIGALGVMTIIFVLALRSGLTPERVLLAGIALSAMVDAVVGVLASSGDPRALLLMRWMSGSTYNVDAGSALAATTAAVLLLAGVMLARRWLDLLPLGTTPAAAIGVRITQSRLILFGLAGLLSATATVCVGPLSFVGLMAPHLAREAGLVRALPQTAGAAAIGAALMVLADWLGRTIAYPYQVPAGLVSALVGAPFLILMMRKGR